MDYNGDEQDESQKKYSSTRMYRRYFNNIGYSILFIIFTFMFVLLCYHISLLILASNGFDSISELFHPEPKNPYEELVHQLVINTKDPDQLRKELQTHAIENHVVPESVLKSADQMMDTRERINKRYQYIEKHRPTLVPTPPDERHLPWDNLYDIVKRWNPDTPEPPADFQERFQHFNYGDPYERSLAEAYRNAEIPFKLYNVSEFNAASLKWDDEYLMSNIKRMRSTGHVEKSKDNHFMFWTPRGGGFRKASYTPPTEIVSDLPFPKYLSIAKQADAEHWTANRTHYYFMLGVPPHDRKYFVGKDLPSFSSIAKNFFITNPGANKGIQCRFGMRGVIAESHYDSGRNMVAMLHGQKRYIITPPWTCKHLGIIADKKHPSYRHSVIDWSDLAQAKANQFEKVDAIDTVLHVGEVLYIPSFWFHYIVSLEYSVQCNSRSGFPEGKKGYKFIEECFHEKV